MTCPHRAVALLVVVSSAALGSGTTAQARLTAFRKEAAAQRAKQGLLADDPKLLREYPAPEVTYPPGVEPPTVCPGQAAQVKLAGRFVPGSLVVALSDDVEVTNEKLGPTSWEAQVKVRPDAPPGDVLVKVMTPVSEAHRVARLLDVGCRHRWTLDVSTGERLTVTTSWPRGANTGVQADGVWSKGGRELATVRLTVHGGIVFGFERVPGPDEVAAGAQARASPQVKALEARLADAQKRVNGCSKGPPAQQQACLESAGKELARNAGEHDALLQKALAPFAQKAGCELVKVRPGAGGLVGEATRCAGGVERASVSGAVTSVR